MRTDDMEVVTGLTIKDVKTEYNSWSGAKYRCFNPKGNGWKNYGGRGITMCPQWRNNFWAFFAHVGRKPSPTHSIDRYPDMNGHYEPGNVRWATKQEQARNSRVSARPMGYRVASAKRNRDHQGRFLPNG